MKETKRQKHFAVEKQIHESPHPVEIKIFSSTLANGKTSPTFKVSRLTYGKFHTLPQGEASLKEKGGFTPQTKTLNRLWFGEEEQ
jgi:hypothetical protein